MFVPPSSFFQVAGFAHFSLMMYGAKETGNYWHNILDLRFSAVVITCFIYSVCILYEFMWYLVMLLIAAKYGGRGMCLPPILKAELYVSFKKCWAPYCF